MMKNIMSMQQLCRRVKELVPSTEFIAKYPATDGDLLLILKQYSKTAVIYLLVSKWEQKKCIIYIGKSINQYTRMLAHKKKYQYDELYLFSVPLEQQAKAESYLIENIKPLYNVSCNEIRRKEIEKLGIEQDGYKSREQILEDIGMLTKNREMVSSAFYIHQKYVVALEMEAKKRGKTASRYLEEILEMEISEEALIDAVRECGEKRQRILELITAKEYAKKNGRSVEQIKVYCRNGRIPGAYKHERDWVIPSSAPYPEDRRKKK